MPSFFKVEGLTKREGVNKFFIVTIKERYIFLKLDKQGPLPFPIPPFDPIVPKFTIAYLQLYTCTCIPALAKLMKKNRTPFAIIITCTTCINDV